MKKPKKGMILIWVGVVLVGLALCLGGYFIWESNRAGKQSEEVASELQEQITENAEEETGMPTDDPDRTMPTITLKDRSGGSNKYIGILEIPALGLKLPVMEDWSYAKLKIAPCRYAGTVYADNMVIAAHNYRSHFSGLKNLTSGAKIYFTDVEGNVYAYEVATLETLQPEQVEEMKSGDWGLTLFTCTPGGKTRVTVRCNRVS